jgi:hypothetical protein
VCVCVCVCVGEREREREREDVVNYTYIHTHKIHTCAQIEDLKDRLMRLGIETAPQGGLETKELTPAEMDGCVFVQLCIFVHANTSMCMCICMYACMHT